MSSPKAGHYHAALTAALLRGAWAEPTPAAAPNGTALSWGELIRKWGKHTGGNTTLIHRLRDISLVYLSSTSHPSSSGFINVTQPGVISGLNTSNLLRVSDEPSSGSSVEIASNTTSGSFIHVPHPHLRRHKSKPSLDGVAPSSSGSTIRPTGSSGEATRATYLSPSDLDGDEEESGSWAEGREWWCGVSLDQVDEVNEGIRALEELLMSGKLKPVEKTSARLILAYHLHAMSSHEAALRIYDEALRAEEVKTGVVEGDAAILDHIRAETLRGISSELVPQPDPDTAIQCYLSATHFVKTVTSFPFPLPAYLHPANKSPTKLPFDSHRELHRFLSITLCRAAVISSRRSNSVTQTLRILRTYHAYSLSWPSSFRPRQRPRMLLLYLRTLLAGFPGVGVAAESPYLLEEGITSSPGRLVWQKEVQAAIAQGRSLLAATTTFPRAGSLNAPVTTFTELCVGLADVQPILAREVIHVLWWSMTLTFQSQSVLRHLTRLQVAVGDKTDARRTFELYIQLALKSRQTQQPEVSLQLKRRPTDDVAASPMEIQRQAEQAKAEGKGDKRGEERTAQMTEAEIDNDDELIGALLIGSRLLLKDLGEPDEAWRYAVLVSDVVENGRKQGRAVRSSLQAEVEEAKGIIRMAMGTKAADPLSRPTYQAQSLSHLQKAVSLDPCSATAFYHLAYCQAEARSIDDAITSIHAALELDSDSVQSWHLLALLLTARGDWAGAAKAGEAGVSVWEAKEDELVDETLSSDDAGVEARDFAMGSPPHLPHTGNTAECLLSRDGSLKPPPSIPPHAYPIPPDMTRAKRLEEVIRLRMTLNVITEKTQGPETAMLRQQELFAFFSARSGKNRGAALGRGLRGNASFSSVGDARDLGGSYISVEPPAADSGMAPAPAPDTMVAVVPPTPNVDSIPTIPSLSAPIGSAPPSNDNSPRSTMPSSPEPTDEEMGTEKLRSGGRAKKALARHLHVPSTLGRGSRPSSVRRLATPSASEANLVIGQNRHASISSPAVSIAPTAVHSHFHASSRIPALPPPPPRSASVEHGRTPAESRILSNLWLMSAATFRRWGKPEQSLVAIEEAETLDPLNPDVWIQLGLHHLSAPSHAPSHAPSSSSLDPLSATYESALAAFTKSILLRPRHAAATVHLSKLYLASGQVELAHQLLNQSTQDEGWDCAEAWYVLGKVCEAQGRHERARECWGFALGLERTRPGGVGGWEGVERWL